MKAVDKEALPTSLLFSSLIYCALVPHLSLSPESEEIRVLAVFIFFFVLAALYSSANFSFS